MDTPNDILNKAFEQTTSSRSNDHETHSPQSGTEVSSLTNEELLKYEDESFKDPLAELPLDMVSYEEKGASR
jgi:sec-independent protein translocase protein TatB